MHCRTPPVLPLADTVTERGLASFAAECMTLPALAVKRFPAPAAMPGLSQHNFRAAVRAEQVWGGGVFTDPLSR